MGHHYSPGAASPSAFEPGTSGFDVFGGTSAASASAFEPGPSTFDIFGGGGDGVDVLGSSELEYDTSGGMGVDVLGSFLEGRESTS